nr:MAG TPA: hypothetical protein [Caudoviricetes sp.]
MPACIRIAHSTFSFLDFRIQCTASAKSERQRTHNEGQKILTRPCLNIA